MVKLFKVIYSIKGQIFSEIFEGNLRINAINQARKKDAENIIDVTEVK